MESKSEEKEYSCSSKKSSKSSSKSSDNSSSSKNVEDTTNEIILTEEQEKHWSQTPGLKLSCFIVFQGMLANMCFHILQSFLHQRANSWPN